MIDRAKSDHGEQTAGLSSTHIVGAIVRRIEIKRESLKGGTRITCVVLKWCRANLQKPMCRQALETRGSPRTPVRFILPSFPAPGSRPKPARLSHILLSFQFGFSGSPMAPENLGWHRAVAVQRLTIRSGRTRFRLVSKGAGTGALLPEPRSFDNQLDAVGPPSAHRGRPRKYAKHLRNLRRKTTKRQHNTGQLKRRRRHPLYR